MIEEIKALYAQIPDFKCKTGCNKCCGPMPFYLEAEWNALPEKRFAKSSICPYKGKQGCENYEYRFFLCRLYGSVKGLECSEGAAPETLLTREQGAKLQKTYFNMEV